jgi:hypothetical protein
MLVTMRAVAVVISLELRRNDISGDYDHFEVKVPCEFSSH